jgi:hypothetical protein
MIEGHEKIHEFVQLEAGNNRADRYYASRLMEGFPMTGSTAAGQKLDENGCSGYSPTRWSCLKGKKRKLNSLAMTIQVWQRRAQKGTFGSCGLVPGPC